MGKKIVYHIHVYYDRGDKKDIDFYLFLKVYRGASLRLLGLYVSRFVCYFFKISLKVYFHSFLAKYLLALYLYTSYFIIECRIIQTLFVTSVWESTFSFGIRVLSLTFKKRQLWEKAEKLDISQLKSSFLLVYACWQVILANSEIQFIWFHRGIMRRIGFYIFTVARAQTPV